MTKTLPHAREKSQRTRGRALQEIRDFHRAIQPLCLRCLSKTPPVTRLWTELDHIKRLEDGGTDDDSNLQGLCHDCHADKTTEERGYTRRAEIGADGWPVDKPKGMGVGNVEGVSLETEPVTFLSR